MKGRDDVSLQTVEIRSIKIVFDAEKTKAYRTIGNEPCECLDCRNYRRNIGNNSELVAFLSGFGIDYNYAEEVLSWELENDGDPMIHYEAYYGVFGKIDGAEFDIEQFGVEIAFQKGAPVPCDRAGEYFWVCVSGNFPYIFDEKREPSVALPQTNGILGFLNRLKTRFCPGKSPYRIEISAHLWYNSKNISERKIYGATDRIEEHL